MKNNEVQVNNNEQVETITVGQALKRLSGRIVKPLLIFGGGAGLAYLGVKTIGEYVSDRRSDDDEEMYDDVVAEQPYAPVEEPTEASTVETNE